MSSIFCAGVSFSVVEVVLMVGGAAAVVHVGTRRRERSRRCRRKLESSGARRGCDICFRRNFGLTHWWTGCGECLQCLPSCGGGVLAVPRGGDREEK